MPAVESKLATVFPADQMVELLRYIDEIVRLIVSAAREQGTQVRGKVTVLLDKYLNLISGVLRECMFLRNFIEMVQGNLEGIENILTLVKDGTVSEVLADLRLEKYRPNFEKEDLHFSYQLMTANFDVEQVHLPTRAAKEALHDRIQEYRVDLDTIKDRIEEVKEEGERCSMSCQEITQKFKTFQEEIKETQDDIIRLLGQNGNSKNDMFVGSLAMLGVSAGLLLAFAGCVAVAVLAPVVIPLQVAGGLAIASGILCGFYGMGSGYVYYKTTEMDEFGAALEKLQAQLDELHLDIGKQKMDWEKIETQAENIVHCINYPKMKRTAGNIRDQPSHRGPVQDVLRDVRIVLGGAKKLQENVVMFKKEALQAQRNLRDLSLLKEADKVIEVPEEASASPIQGLLNIIARLVKAM